MNSWCFAWSCGLSFFLFIPIWISTEENIGALFILLGLLFPVIWLVLLLRKRKKTYGEEWCYRDSLPGDWEYVRYKVERLKRRAEKKGLKDLVCSMYFDVVKYCPVWIKNKEWSGYIKSVVEYARSGTTKEKYDFTEIGLSGKKFKFIYEETTDFHSDLEGNTKENRRGSLELFCEGKKVFVIWISTVSYNNDSIWRHFERTPHEIESFIDGDRYKDLNKLQIAYEKDRKELDIKNRNIREKEETERLKKNFGI